jgi:hypothetical protein
MYEPLKRYVSRAGGVRLSTHPSLRDRIVEWAVEEFPVDAPPDKIAEVLTARLRIRVRDQYESIIASILLGVLIQLIVRAVVAWWNRNNTHKVLMRGWRAEANPDV